MPRDLRKRLLRFARSESLASDRARRVAARFERAHGSLILLELAYQAQASVDEIESLAEARGAIPSGVFAFVAWAWSFAVAIVRWFTDLWPRTARDIYAAMAERAAHAVSTAADLRVAALREGDAEVAAFCVDWMNARSGLAARLVESFAADDAVAQGGPDFPPAAAPLEAHR